MEYNQSKASLYLGLGSIVANMTSSIFLGMAIEKGKLEDIALWGGITLLNTVSACSNCLIAYNSKRNKKDNLKFK